MAEWRHDLTWSNQLFLEHVWPRIRAKCGGGDIIPVEIIEDNDLAKQLDILCGIDIWHNVNGEGARGIASRVQNNKNPNYRGRQPFNTFSVRYRRFSGAKTEYAKRVEAIESGRYIFPYLTCQAYFDFGGFVSCGLAKTVDIFNHIEGLKTDGEFNEQQLRANRVLMKTGNAEFFAIPFKNVGGVYVITEMDKAA